MFEPQPKIIERPIPYIADFSATGLLTIRWDRPMVPYNKPKEIPPTQIAVKAEILEDEDRNRKVRRMLDDQTPEQVVREEIWFKQKQSENYVRMLLLDALEIQITQDSDSDLLSENL